MASETNGTRTKQRTGSICRAPYRVETVATALPDSSQSRRYEKQTADGDYLLAAARVAAAATGIARRLAGQVARKVITERGSICQLQPV